MITNERAGGMEIWLAVKTGAAKKIHRLVPGGWFLFNRHHPLASEMICFFSVRVEGVRVCVDVELDEKRKQLQFEKCYQLGDYLLAVFVSRQEADESLCGPMSLDCTEI